MFDMDAGWDAGLASSRKADSEESAADDVAALVAGKQSEIATLAQKWNERKAGAMSVARLTGEITEACQAARSRWERNRGKGSFQRASESIIGAVLESKRNEMLFKTTAIPGARSLARLAPPSADASPLVSDPLVAQSHANPVAADVVQFVKALRARNPGFTAETYHMHGGGPFRGRGYSIDLNVAGPMQGGFFSVTNTLKLLMDVNATAQALGMQWRALYNDFRVAESINRKLGAHHVVYMGTVFRDKNRRPYNINWHGPNPLICHIHLDLTKVPRGQPTSAVATVQSAMAAAPGTLGRVIDRGAEALLLASLLARGMRDESALTSEVFYARHPERKRRKIASTESQAVAEWRSIRDQLVRPRLHSSSAPSGESEAPSLLAAALGPVGIAAEGAARLAREAMLLSALISKGERNEAKLASEVFYARHPERSRRPLDATEHQGIEEWKTIRDHLVRSMLAKFAVPAAPSRPKATAADTFKVGKFDGWVGLSSPGIAPVGKSLATEPYSIAVATTSKLEGTFDKVQTYDRGILSWGIKQWTLHAGSLQKMLGFIHRQLTSSGQAALWTRLFPGLQIVDSKLQVDGRLVATKDELMRWVRNSTSPTEFDRAHMVKVMEIFVRAGRDPTIQSLQLAHAVSELRTAVAQKPMVATRAGNDWRFSAIADAKPIGTYLQGNTRALAFFQSMYTQNPAWAKVYVGNLVTALRQRLGAEAAWPPNWGALALQTYEESFRMSGVACWGTAALSKSNCRGRQSRYQKTVRNLHTFTG